MYLHTVMSPQQLERRALSMVRGLSDQLRSSCSGVVSSAQGLPATVQDQLTSAKRSAEELHSSLGTTSNLTPLLLQQSRHQLTQVRIVFHPFQTVLYFCWLRAWLKIAGIYSPILKVQYTIVPCAKSVLLFLAYWEKYNKLRLIIYTTYTLDSIQFIAYIWKYMYEQIQLHLWPTYCTENKNCCTTVSQHYVQYDMIICSFLVALKIK